MKCNHCNYPIDETDPDFVHPLRDNIWVCGCINPSNNCPNSVLSISKELAISEFKHYNNNLRNFKLKDVLSET